MARHRKGQHVCEVRREAPRAQHRREEHDDPQQRLSSARARARSERRQRAQRVAQRRVAQGMSDPKDG